MNDPRSFVLGWAAFGVAGTVGAYLGWRENNANQMQRRVEDIEVTKKRDLMLKKFNDRSHKEGSYKALQHLQEQHLKEEQSKQSAHPEVHGAVPDSLKISKDKDLD
jgi:Flp pilus assembly protein TadB